MNSHFFTYRNTFKYIFYDLLSSKFTEIHPTKIGHLSLVQTFHNFHTNSPRYRPRSKEWQRSDYIIALPKSPMGHLSFFKWLSSFAGKKCWHCGKSVTKDSKLFCEHCNTLQQVNKEESYFEMFEMNQSYNVDLQHIRKKYRDLQTLLHPDRFTSKSKEEQEISDEFSSTVNKAYTTLSNPLKRGLYLLSLHNISIEEGSTQMDKEFLLEIMERNEEIENETDPKNLNDYFTTNRSKVDSLIKEVSKAFDSGDTELAKKLLTEMKYYNSIDVKIKEIKQKLNIPD